MDTSLSWPAPSLKSVRPKIIVFEQVKHSQIPDQLPLLVQHGNFLDPGLDHAANHCTHLILFETVNQLTVHNVFSKLRCDHRNLLLICLAELFRPTSGQEQRQGQELFSADFSCHTKITICLLTFTDDAMIKGICGENDSVLVDTEHLYFAASRHALKLIGRRQPLCSAAEPLFAGNYAKIVYIFP